MEHHTQHRKYCSLNLEVVGITAGSRGEVQGRKSLWQETQQQQQQQQQQIDEKRSSRFLHYIFTLQRDNKQQG